MDIDEVDGEKSDIENKFENLMKSQMCLIDEINKLKLNINVVEEVAVIGSKIDNIFCILKRNEENFDLINEKLNVINKVIEDNELLNKSKIKVIKDEIIICNKSIEAVNLKEDSLKTTIVEKSLLGKKNEESFNLVNEKLNFINKVIENNELLNKSEVKAIKDEIIICNKSLEAVNLKEDNLKTKMVDLSEELLIVKQNFVTEQKAIHLIKRKILQANEFIWKIDNFSKRMRDAETGKIINIISEPFFSHKNGYKMRLVLYPRLSFSQHKDNKMEIVYYLGLHFCLMRGLYDDILEWPLQHTVNLFIRSQESVESLILHQYQVSNVSNIDKACFNRPTKDENIICGSEKFIEVNELLKNKSLIKNDSFYVGCQVNLF